MRLQTLSVAISELNFTPTAVLFVDKLIDPSAVTTLTADFQSVAAEVMESYPARMTPDIQFTVATPDDPVHCSHSRHVDVTPLPSSLNHLTLLPVRLWVR
jgi:hypothetical protein